MATIQRDGKAIPIEREDAKRKVFSLSLMLRNLAKRFFDITVAFIGLTLLSPFFLVFSILIKRDTPGPAFYWCRRMGRNQQPFRMLKFRTMYEHAEGQATMPVTCKDDERITPLGHWLRDTKINELPQLWNVFIGEMSLVGPRPEDVAIAEDWPEEAKAEILSVRPGITSPASILYHDEENLLTQTNVMGEYVKNILPDKMRLDRLYVRNQSFTSDLDLIFWTLIIIIPLIAKSKIPEGYLFAGPISRLINRYISWFLIDWLIALIVIGFVGVLWRIQEPLDWGMNYLAMLALIIAFVFSGVNSIAGLNRILWEKATIDDGLSLAFTGGLVTLLVVLFDYLQAIFHWFDAPSLPVVMIIAAGLLAQIGFTVARFRWRVITFIASRWLTLRQNATNTGEKVLIVGSGEGYQVANWLLRHGELQYIFSIVGLVDDDIPQAQGMRLNGCMVLGSTSELPELVKKHDVGIVLFTTTHIPNDIRDYVFQLCQNSFVRVAFIDNLIESIHQQLIRPVTSLEYSLWSDDHAKFLSLHDYVTGLPNRFLFQDQLMRSLAYARRYNTKTFVLFIRLTISPFEMDTAGHKTHDAVLKEFSKRLLRIKRESDTLARLDDLGFAIILENIGDEHAIAMVAKRILIATSEPVRINQQEYCLHVNTTFCDNLDCFPPNEIGDIRRFYMMGKPLPQLDDGINELALSKRKERANQASPVTQNDSF